MTRAAGREASLPAQHLHGLQRLDTRKTSNPRCCRAHNPARGRERVLLSIAMTVGEELERARKSRRLSLEEISARTKVSVERLVAIAQTEVCELPAIVSLRALLRSYAIEVGLDPDEVVECYIAQFDEGGLDDFACEAVDREPDDRKATVVDLPSRENSIQRSEMPEGTPLKRPARFAQHSLSHPNSDSWDPSGAAIRSRPPFAALTITALIAVAAGYLSANFDKWSLASQFLSQVMPSRTSDSHRVERSRDEVVPAAPALSGGSEGGRARRSSRS